MKERTSVVLINPPVRAIVEEYDAPPYGHLGLAYLSSALREGGLSCAVLDAKLARLNRNDLVKVVLDLDPRIVGISSFTHEIKIAAALAEEIKKKTPWTKIVIGGVHASSLPADTIRSFPSFDYLVKGEGERAFLKLSRAILNGDEEAVPAIPGVCYRKDGNAVLVSPAPRISDLDSLKFPAWDLFPKMRIFPVMSSRGCPYGCVFCARMMGEEVRVRSPENVAEELRYLNERFGAKRVFFYDETFGFYREWLDKFLRLLIDSKLNRKLRWGITTRAHLLDGPILSKLKEAGCVKIDFGVESGNEQVLSVIKKGERLEDFIRAARLVKKAGIESQSYFILGHPNETRKTAADTIDFAAKLNTDHVSIGIMVPYPGTEVAEMAAKGAMGYKKLSPDWEDYNKKLGNAL
ncbi:MAG: radical SAM protein [Candidatus Omnitrophica bacterium]|nr:radical SAM protein [Candidatus Omnitrophota bacterium]